MAKDAAKHPRDEQTEDATGSSDPAQADEDHCETTKPGPPTAPFFFFFF